MITITTLFRHHNYVTGSNQNRDRMGMRFTATSLCENGGVCEARVVLQGWEGVVVGRLKGDVLNQGGGIESK